MTDAPERIFLQDGADYETDYRLLKPWARTLPVWAVASILWVLGLPLFIVAYTIDAVKEAVRELHQEIRIMKNARAWAKNNRKIND